MAIHADTTWEFQSLGSDNNGGGFYDRNPGTSVDYTQQTTAQLTLTDLVGAGTALSSVTGGFTAAMAGNLINITAGTGFTPGRYEIVTYTDTNNVVIDRTAGAAGSAGTGYVGGAIASFLDVPIEAWVAGNTAHVKNDGTYTLTENIDIAKDGTAAAYIKVYGYNVTRGDNPQDDDRPLIACGAYTFSFDNFWAFKDLRVTTTASLGWKGDGGTLFVNCKVNNTSVSSNRYGFDLGGIAAAIINCEAISTLGYAIYAGNGRGVISASYIHDSARGIHLIASGITVTGNIIDTNSQYGIYLDSGADQAVVNGNTIYNNTTAGIRVNNSDTQRIFNNDITGNGNGINGTGTDFFQYIDYNNYKSNTADVAGFAVKGDHATAETPGYTNAAGGDFANLLSATAMPKDTFPGGLTPNYLRQGAPQQDAGNGGGESSFVTIT